MDSQRPRGGRGAAPSRALSLNAYAIAQETSVSLIGTDLAAARWCASLAARGLRVIINDVSPDRIEPLRHGRLAAASGHPELEAAIKAGIGRGAVDATTNLIAAVLDSDATLICFERMPNIESGEGLRLARHVCRAIGHALSLKDGYHIVLFDQVTPTRTTGDLLIAEIEASSGRRLGMYFGAAFGVRLEVASPTRSDGFDERAEAFAKRICGLPGGEGPARWGFRVAS